ncbi:MAG: PIN domain-containing protein [Dehalococcoidia bacterium]
MIVDSGPLFAALDRTDAEHAPCLRLFTESSEPLLVPAPVVVEVDYWIRKHLRAEVEDAFLADLEVGALSVVDVLPQDYPRIRELCRTYYDSDLGFVDASILTIAERLNVTRIATLDHRHFRMMRPRHVDALTLLPE